MSAPPGEYYSEERWQNWIDRIKNEDLDPEDEDSARLLLNLQDDASIAVAKIIAAFEDETLDEEAALTELADIRDVVLADTGVTDEEKALLLDGVQTSLVCVFVAAEQFIVAGAADPAPIAEYIKAAAEAESSEDLDAALGYTAQAGTRIIDGDDLDIGVLDDIEYGLVAEWVNGLDSLQSAMSDPEVVEADDE